MKPKLIISALTLLFFTACTKDKQPEKPSALLGKWNLRANYVVHSNANRIDTVTAVYADEDNITINEYTSSMVTYYTKYAGSEAGTISFNYKIVGDKEIDVNALTWTITYDDKTLKRVRDATDQPGYSEVQIYDRIKD
ncbi:MAG: hypothetical protein AAGC65_23535 [Mucilaginibacter sp.]|uniref:hypothetical protein n=1 Tax=Mucilaginibacter sp. TaxID=1882438 RepID=UPI0031A384F3